MICLLLPIVLPIVFLECTLILLNNYYFACEFCLILCRLSWHDFGVRQWRIDGTIFVPKYAPLTVGGKNCPIFGTKLVAKTATMQFGTPKGGMLWMLNITQPQNEKAPGKEPLLICDVA